MSLELLRTPYKTNLKAYYRFESGALTTDSSGNSHTLTAISDPAANVAGKFGGCIDLDGNDAYSSVDHADFKPTGNFSFGCWYKTNTKAALQGLFQSYSANTNVAGIRAYLDTSGYINFTSGKNSGTTVNVDYKNVTTSTDRCNNAWHFLVCTFDGTKMHVYDDGVEFGTGTAWANAAAYAATNYVRIGCLNNTGGDVVPLTGSMDDVFVINGTVLTSTQISNIYNQRSKATFLMNLIHWKNN